MPMSMGVLRPGLISTPRARRRRSRPTLVESNARFVLNDNHEPWILGHSGGPARRHGLAAGGPATLMATASTRPTVRGRATRARQAQGASSDLALRQAQGAGSRSLRIGPPPFDPAKARPPAIVSVHVSEEALRAGTGVTRVEDIGPVLLTRLRQVLGTSCQIRLKPVINLNDEPAPVDSYEIPARIAEHLRLRQPADVFPYAAGGSRRTDLDHTLRYQSLNKGGPPGQTAVGKLGPHVRYHHRVKTHGQWNVRQPEPGTWVWRTPHGRIFLVNSSGTHALGKGGYAQQIWRAAKAPPEPEPSRADRKKSAQENRARPNSGVHADQLTVADSRRRPNRR